jgi:hypothetical protein
VIIDFHTHIFPDKIADAAMKKMMDMSQLTPVLDGKEKSLIESMERSGVDMSIVLPVATNPLKCDSLNQYAASINEKYKGKKHSLLCFAGVHPYAPDLEALFKRIVEMGFKGIKLHPDYQGFFFDDPKCKKTIELAEKNNLVTVVHSGLDYGYVTEIRCTPQRILDVARDLKPKRLVMAHFGANSMWYDVEKTICGLGLYFDTAFINPRISDEQLVRIIRANGADKILFATDSPWNDQKKDIDFIERQKLSVEEKSMIFSENALSLI